MKMTLVLSHKSSNAFVQFANHGLTAFVRKPSAMRIYRRRSISAASQAALLALGWHAPTYVQLKGSSGPSDGSPNYFLDAAQPVLYDAFAAVAIASPRKAYDVSHSLELQYSAYNIETSREIGFPSLKLDTEPAIHTMSESLG
jgi:hypothetical protein